MRAIADHSYGQRHMARTCVGLQDRQDMYGYS